MDNLSAFLDGTSKYLGSFICTVSVSYMLNSVDYLFDGVDRLFGYVDCVLLSRVAAWFSR